MAKRLDGLKRQVALGCLVQCDIVFNGGQYLLKTGTIKFLLPWAQQKKIKDIQVTLVSICVGISILW